MNLLRNFYSVVIEALFPLTRAEEALMLLTPEEAFRTLPVAPPYDGSVVPLPHTCSIFAYQDERVSKLIWSIKYKKSPHSVSLGGYALKQSLEKMFEKSPGTAENKLLIVPIPITLRRRRERGYNQCELLVDELGRLDMGQKFLVEKNLLVRVQHKSRQTMKGRDERLESAKGIFAMNEEVAQTFSRNQPVVVIDDVITTGSTMKEALDVLKCAGFTDVSGLSLAH